MLLSYDWFAISTFFSYSSPPSLMGKPFCPPPPVFSWRALSPYLPSEVDLKQRTRLLYFHISSGSREVRGSLFPMITLRPPSNTVGLLFSPVLTPFRLMPEGSSCSPNRLASSFFKLSLSGLHQAFPFLVLFHQFVTALLFRNTVFMNPLDESYLNPQ